MATATAKKLPIWVWEAKTRAGEVKKGEMEASDKSSVEARLRQMGMNPAKIKKKPVEINIRLPGSTGVKRKDLVVFTRQFATMIDAGLPLVQCLEILGTQSPNPVFRGIIKSVKEKVESGATLADGLAEHPKVFDELYCELVRAGEVGGILDTILNRLAAYIENADKLVRKVKGALTYPVIVLLVAIGVTALLLIKVVPVFEKMFKDFGSALPGPDPDDREHVPLRPGQLLVRDRPHRGGGGGVQAHHRQPQGPLLLGPHQAQGPDVRRSHPEDGGRPVHPDARHHDSPRASPSSTPSTSVPSPPATSWWRRPSGRFELGSARARPSSSPSPRRRSSPRWWSR